MRLLAHLASVGLGLVLSACASANRPTFERFDPRVTPTASDHPDVPAIVLLDRGLLTFSMDPERGIPLARLRRYRRLKILRPSGRTLANVEVPYDPGTVVFGLIARSVQPTGRTNTVANPADVAHAGGTRAKVLSVPDVGPSSVVEYTYDVFMEDLRFIPPWVFQCALPTVRSEFAVVVPPGFSVDLRYSTEGRFVDRPPERFEVGGATRYSWSSADLPPRFDESPMPAPDLLAPRAHVLFLGARLNNKRFRGFDSWDAVVRWHEKRFAGWQTLSPPTVDEARRVAGDSPPEERALKLMEVLARDLPAGPGAVPPLWRAPANHPDRVLSARQANPTTRGMLLTALLNAVDVPAVPGLVAYGDRDVILPDAPTVRALHAVVAVVPRPRGPLILDPNQLTVSTEVPSPALQDTRLVVVQSEGAEVLRVPTSPPSASASEIDFALKLAPRGGLSGTVNLRATGAEAGRLRRRLFDGNPEDYATTVSEFLNRRGVAVAVESVSIADLRALRRPLSIKAKIAPRQALKGQGTFVRVGDILGWPTEPVRQTRRSPLLLGAPHAVEVRGTLVLPEGYEPDVMPPRAEHRFDGVSVELSIRAETRQRIGFVRRERWSRTEVSVDQYRAFHRFVQAVRASEDEAFSIKRPPERPLEY